ncbi:MAG TPA: T9SS type A sorting domain-containing protein, partial [Flavisolibacter sp.]|nr:T9SS type A sorting domain-containing protein [Flavisolibacter sp.]
DNISVIATKKQSAGTVNPEHTEAEEANMKVSVSPNPNSGSFEVTYSTSREGKVSATLLNSNGSAVFTKQVNAQKGQNRMEVNRPGLAKGMYFLLIETPDGSFKEKVLIK